MAQERTRSCKYAAIKEIHSKRLRTDVLYLFVCIWAVYVSFTLRQRLARYAHAHNEKVTLDFPTSLTVPAPVSVFFFFFNHRKVRNWYSSQIVKSGPLETKT
jgi:hypothetical protein